jgi:hypothetical protein
MNGCCLCVTVLDHDIVSYNDLAGQSLLPLASIPKLKSLSTKHLPRPIVLPLILPNHPLQYDEHFRVIVFNFKSLIVNSKIIFKGWAKSFCEKISRGVRKILLRYKVRISLNEYK